MNAARRVVSAGFGGHRSRRRAGRTGVTQSHISEVRFLWLYRKCPGLHPAPERPTSWQTSERPLGSDRGSRLFHNGTQ